MGISSPGIGSNLDVNSIVSQLMAVEQQPLTDLARKEAGVQSKIAAFGSLSGALGTFQSALSNLTDPAKFQTVNATAADDTILKGTATTQAVSGTYNVNVTQLAQAQTVVTAGQASSTAAIGDGAKTTLTFTFGTISGGKLQNGVYAADPGPPASSPAFAQDTTKVAGSVVIDSTNNTLQGVRDAINKANLGVTATIVSDGSANPYHLVLTSNATGANSSMQVAVARDPLAPADSSMSNLLSYDPAGTQNMTQTSVAQDTQLTVNGIAITGHGTSVSDAIQGVTMNVSKIGTTNLTVARDSSSVTNNVNAFVKAYNDLNTTMANLTKYDSSTKTGGPLLGDSTVMTIQSQLRNMLGGRMPNATGSYDNLMAVGITFQKDGTLAVDSSKLSSAIAASPDDVAALFSSQGKATDSLVSFTSAGASAATGTFAVHVNALATKGSAVATAAPTSTTVVAGTNDELSITLNGVSTSITLAPGNYTSSTLASTLQSQINGTSELLKAGLSVAVSADASGILSVTTNAYGADAKVQLGGSAQNILFPGDTETAGTDASGTINGAIATGSGQYLSTSDGLKIQVNGGATGDRGSVSFARGFAELVSNMVDTFKGTGGMITGSTDGLQSTIKTIGQQRDAITARLAGTEARYRAQFNALDTAIAQMNSTSQYLTQQLASIAANR
jgi:flagellar hook-associated protein 2